MPFGLAALRSRVVEESRSAMSRLNRVLDVFRILKAWYLEALGVRDRTQEEGLCLGFVPGTLRALLIPPKRRRARDRSIITMIRAILASGRPRVRSTYFFKLSTVKRRALLLLYMD